MHPDAAAVFLADDTPKSYWAGGHRAAHPSETLDRIRPHFRRMGLTRLAEVTGLDRVGMPVVQAIRPMARNLSVNQGKGLTVLDARVSAAMEAAESWHAESPPGAVTRGSAAGLGGAADLLHPALWARQAGLQTGAQPDSETGPQIGSDAGPQIGPQTGPQTGPTARLGEETLTWLGGRDLLTGRATLVPADAVLMDYAVPAESAVIPRSSVGLAAGNTRAEAVLSALLELIEEDGLRAFRALPEPERARRLVRRGDVRDALPNVVGALAQAGLWLDVWEIGTDLDVPAYLARLREPEAARASYRIAAASGSGAHLAPKVAVSRAVTEAVQSRLTLISGVREDVPPEAYRVDPSAGRFAAAQSLFAGDLARALRGTDQSGPSAGADVATLLARLARARPGPLVAVDLTQDEIGVPVVRVVAPGLSGPLRSEDAEGELRIG